MQLLSLNSLDLAALENLMASLGYEKYRAAQIFGWLHKEKCLAINDMSNLPKKLREALSDVAEISTLKEISRLTSKVDGSVKILFELSDGARIESVLLKDRDRMTGCISTQVGCKMGCTFCTTATVGFKRNLSAGEIVAQVSALEKISYEMGFCEEPRLTGIVIMGMGEPLDNLNPTLCALTMLMSEIGYGYSHRRITLSTSGIADKLKVLFSLKTPVNLAVSLNASTEEKRQRIMPISKKFPLKNLLDELKKLPIAKRKRITFEYVLFGGFNDSKEDAAELLQLVKGFPVKINLIRYNGGGSDKKLVTPTEKAVLAFQKILMDKGLTVFIRKSFGVDICGACGQLSADYSQKGS